MRYLASFLVAAAIFLGLHACAWDFRDFGHRSYHEEHRGDYRDEHRRDYRTESQNFGTMPASCDNGKFLRDQEWFGNSYASQDDRKTFPEHICGTVVQVSPARRTRSGLHGYFLMKVGNGSVIRIVSNLDEMGGNWPWVVDGDSVEVQGRYYYDSPDQQGIDWTHHGTSSRWPFDGFVEVNGTKYQ